MQRSELDAFKNVLKQNGCQVTRARQQTFSLLIGTGPQTMNELLSKANGQVDRVSVYRNIALFEKLGIVHRVYIGWKYKIELSDVFTSHHHHLTCLGCGTVIDIADERHIDTFIHSVSAQYGFTPRRHQFEIDGYCADCSDT